MPESAFDLSEIMDLYKADARRMVGEIQSVLGRWPEVAAGQPPRQDLRRLAHQLRGSGRTYGFHQVSRVCKAMEKIVQKIEEGRIAADESVRESLAAKAKVLSTIFNG